MTHFDTWVMIQEEIKASGSPGMKLVLENFHKRYFATCKHCWVPGMRKRIAEAWEKEKAQRSVALASGTRYIESNIKGQKSDNTDNNSEPSGNGTVDSEASGLAGLSA